MMDATPGWSPSETPRHWQRGALRMACETTVVSGSPWLERLSGRVTLVEAAVVMDSKRTTSVAWRLSDGGLLKVNVIEQTTEWKPDVQELGADKRLHTTSPDDVDATFELWEKRGLVIRDKNR